MKAIMTKYIGPTNHKGSRIKASDEDGNHVTIGYRSELDSYANHLAAAKWLCAKMEWRGTLHGGGIKNGYVFVWGAGKGERVT